MSINKFEELVKKFHKNIIYHGNEYYLRYSKAHDFILEAKEMGIAFTGIETFVHNRKKDSIMPLLELIAIIRSEENEDWKTYLEKSCKYLLEFVDKIIKQKRFLKKENLILNFTPLDEIGWNATSNKGKDGQASCNLSN